MPFITYEQKRISGKRLDLINTCNGIINDFGRQGYNVTLRQLYYQLVSKAIIENTDQSYKRIGQLVTDARMGGLMDWDAVVDRTRQVRKYPISSGPTQTLERAGIGHSIDLWQGQDWRLEVWVEKDALAQVVQRAVSSYRVPVMVCRGYMSVSAMWEAGRNRFAANTDKGLRTAVIHLGDHDPSGVDMSRDIADRLSTFAGEAIEVDRIALSMNQVEQYRPPPNPAKVTDSRAKEYISKFGRKSWELDALQPAVLDDLIKKAITKRLNQDAFDERLAEEKHGEDEIELIAEYYDDVIAFLHRDG